MLSTRWEHRRRARIPEGTRCCMMVWREDSPGCWRAERLCGAGCDEGGSAEAGRAALLMPDNFCSCCTELRDERCVLWHGMTLRPASRTRSPGPQGCHVSLAGDPNPSRQGFSSAGSSQREDRQQHCLPVLSQQIQQPSCLGSQTAPGLSFLPQHCRLGHLLLHGIRAGAGSPELSHQV